jgi:hypothetical protein
MSRHRITACLTALVLAVTVSGSLARADEACSGAAIVAGNSVHLKKSSRVTGDVVVAAPSVGPTLYPGVELGIDRLAVIDGSATAEGLLLSRDATITGDVFADQLSDQGGTIGGSVFGFSPGVLPTFQQAVLHAGTGDVFVGAGQVVTLAAGDYGDVAVAQTGTLVFDGGIFNLRSLASASTAGGSCPFPCRSVTFSAPSDVRIEGRFEISKESYVGPAPGSGITASDIVLYVGGQNGGDGSLNALPPAVNVGRDSLIEAGLYAANGTLSIDQGTVAVGALVGRDVRLNQNVQLSADSFFRNRPPIAAPQTVFTSGGAGLPITLTGSDPEHGDLAFSIAVAPAAGSLSAVTPIVPAPVPEIGPDGLPTGNLLQPPVVSATVIYTPAGSGNVTDAFTFEVTDLCGASGLAVVQINLDACDGSSPPCEPPPVVTTVVALDASAETHRDLAVTITLTAGAPCDGACDGNGDDVPLTFAIPGGTPATTTAGGTVAGLVQGGEVPRRTATVTYTPAAGFVSPPADSFAFEACGTIGGDVVCDSATATITVGGPTLLAEDVEAVAEANAAVEIMLIGNPGGVGDDGKSSLARQLRQLKAVGLAEAAAVGAVVDTDFDGFGDLVAAGSGGSDDGSDFETPVLGAAEDRRVIDPYVFGDTVIGVDGGGGTFVVGLVKNSATSACVDPSSSDQKLGIGTAAAGSIGLSSAPVRATFPGALPAGSQVSVEFQTSLGTPIRLRLFDAGDQPVGSAAATASPAAGQCGLPGPARARTTLTATATGSAAYAVMDLDTATGGVVFVLDHFAFSTGGTVSAGLDTPETGERRLQIEWDVSGFPTSGLVSASVTVHTVKGEDDGLDTRFFAGDAEQDAVVTPSDFEAAASAVSAAVMPVPADPVGTEGTFTFDVLGALVAAVGRDVPLQVFSIQGRVDLESAGQGLQVRTDPPPTLEYATPPPIPPSVLEFTVLSLPTLGTLFTSAGSPVVVGQLLPSPILTYVGGSSGGFDSFTYQVRDLGVLGTAGVFVDLHDGCVENGRPPGCAPGN